MPSTFRSAFFAVVLSLAMPSLGMALGVGAKGSLCQPVHQAPLGSMTLQAIHTGKGSVPHQLATLSNPAHAAKSPRLRPYELHPSAGGKAPRVSSNQRPARQDLGLPRAPWTRFFVPLAALLWIAATLRASAAGWPQQWPNRPPPFVRL